MADLSSLSDAQLQALIAQKQGQAQPQAAAPAPAPSAASPLGGMSDQQLMDAIAQKQQEIRIPVQKVTEAFGLGTEPEDLPPVPLRGLPGATGGFLQRGAFEAAGGIGGAALAGGAALPTGPGALAAAAGGGALGTAAGGQVFDRIDEIVREFKDEPLRQDQLAPAAQALKDITVDAAFTTGLGATGNVVRSVKPTVAKILGVGNERTRDIAETAQKMGIDVGVLQASKAGLSKGFSTVVGVFPFIGTPLIQGQARTVGQINAKAADLLNTLGPSLPKFDVSRALVDGSVRRFAAFNRLSSSLYNRANTIAANLSVPDVAPTLKARGAARNTLDDLSAEAITVEGREIGRQSPDIAEFSTVLNDMKSLPEHITVQQARGFQRKFKAIADNTTDNFIRSRASKMIGEFKDSIKELDTSRLPPEEAKAVTEAFSKANTFFKKNAGVFTTPTAKKFVRVDKGAFKPGGVAKPGTINADEIFDVLKARSPDAVDDLKRLVGAGKFNNFVRKSIQRDIDSSVTKASEGSGLPDLFSAQKFRERLGIGTPDGDAAFEAMLKDRPGFAKDFRKFLDLAETATDIVIKNPSTFVTRKLVLGGSAVNAALIGAGSVSLPVAGLITAATRKLSRALMNPRVLRDLNMAMEPVGVSDLNKNAAIVRLLRGSGSGNKEQRQERTR
jgi:hypothetical protein